MSNATADPEEVFLTALAAGTSLLVVLVPSRDRASQPIDQDFWVDEVLSTLGRLFCGATAYPRGRGVWRNDEQGGALVKEEPVIVFSYVAADATTTETLTALYRTLSHMGRETNQGEVGVVIDGKYYGITKYASE